MLRLVLRALLLLLVEQARLFGNRAFGICCILQFGYPVLQHHGEFMLPWRQRCMGRKRRGKFLHAIGALCSVGIEKQYLQLALMCLDLKARLLQF